MACNPCCCLSLKDAVVTIGIWSTVSTFFLLKNFNFALIFFKMFGTLRNLNFVVSKSKVKFTPLFASFFVNLFNGLIFVF